MRTVTYFDVERVTNSKRFNGKQDFSLINVPDDLPFPSQPREEVNDPIDMKSKVLDLG